jgi:hypothetical protein
MMFRLKYEWVENTSGVEAHGVMFERKDPQTVIPFWMQVHQRQHQFSITESI